MKENTVMQKSLAFSIRIVNLNKYLCSQKNEYVMSKQICKSGTSIGANIAETQWAQSTADFVSKMKIALKEEMKLSIGCNCCTKQSISQIRSSPVFMTIWWKS